MYAARGTSFAWLGHPVTVLALVLLVVNDHVLKAAYPGWVTGKLSDAAGLVLAPPLLAAVLGLRRRWPALIAVGAGFALVKAWPPAAGVVSELFSLARPHSVIRADVTDLLALPSLAVAWWTWQAVRDRPPSVRRVRALRVAVLLPLALAGVAATSAPVYESAIRTVATPDGLYLGTTDLYRADGRTSWVFTTDLVTYREVDYDPRRRLDRLYPEPVPQSCSTRDPRVCYRVVPGAIGVQASTDAGATWADAWGITEAQRRRLARYYRAREVHPDRDLISTSVAVLDQPDGRHAVAVANGRDGFAVRSPDGGWARVGTPSSYGPSTVPELGAADPDDRRLDVMVPIGAIAAMVGLVLTAGGALAASRSAGAGSPWFIAPVAIPVAAAVILAVAADQDSLMAWPVAVAGAPLLVIAALVLGLAVTAYVLGRAPGRRGWALLLWAAGLLTAVLGAVVWLLLWDGVAEPGTLRTIGLAFAACTPGLVLAWVAGLRIRPAPPTYGSGISSPGWTGSAGR